jgi:putative methionine-R-sulfoxide reductase with GAF domain
LRNGGGARETVIVPTNAFPGHIACDPKSKSEIVVPVSRQIES